MVRKKLRATCMVIVQAPWRTPAGHEIRHRGARHADVVDAAVVVEALVLGGEDRVDHRLGDVLDRDERAPLLAEFADQRAFGAVDPQRDLRLVVSEHFQRRQRRIHDDRREGDRGLRPRQKSDATSNSGKAHHRTNISRLLLEGESHARRGAYVRY